MGAHSHRHGGDASDEQRSACRALFHRRGQWRCSFKKQTSHTFHLGQTRPSVYAARDCGKRNCTHGDEGNHTQGAATVHRGLFYNESPDEEPFAVTVFARFAVFNCSF